MIKKSFTFKINDETISTNILSKNNLTMAPRFIFLHGAGTGNKERVHSIATPIINNNVNILTLDFSGHGESTGELKKSSLKKRFEEANAAIKQLSSQEPLIICGSSMGGYIAIKLLDFYKVDTLILFCPALYDKNAYNVRFDAGFTEMIRIPGSWKNTDALDSLEKFTGNLLIVIGENDEVIPAGVIDLIIQHSPNVSKKELYVIPNCPHTINTWIINQKEEQAKLHQKILEYVK